MKLFEIEKNFNIKEYKLFGKAFLVIETKKNVKNVYLFKTMVFSKLNIKEFLKIQSLQIRLEKLQFNVNRRPTASITGEITALCDKYGSDKGSSLLEYSEIVHPYPWNPHTYSHIYEQLFTDIKCTVKNVFECGLGTNNENIASNMTKNGKPGASLRVWRDYFSNAKIYGADIDKDILFSEERIHTGWIDQTSEKAIEDFFNELNIQFDIMIDDGLHTSEAAICLFKNSFQFLSLNGIYIIEDIHVDSVAYVIKYLNTRSDVSYSCIMMDCPEMKDNNLIIITKNKNFNAKYETIRN